MTVPKKKGSNDELDQIEGKWNQRKGKIRENWGELTDAELDIIVDKRDALVGKLQEKYGMAKEEVKRQISEWQKALKF